MELRNDPNSEAEAAGLRKRKLAYLAEAEGRKEQMGQIRSDGLSPKERKWKE